MRLSAPALVISWVLSCGLLLAAGLVHAHSAQSGQPARLLSQPTVSAEHLAFIHAGDLWVSDRKGGQARRLTSTPATESDPYFSPDGRLIAYASEQEGNKDVFVISVDGGTPRRLTWHPEDDVPTGWSADGSEVAFVSARQVDQGRSGQLWHVPAQGGAPVLQMAARFVAGSWDEEGRRLAYIDFAPAYAGLYGGSAGWRGYRGGTTPSVKIFDPKAGELQTIPGHRVNDFQPFWLDGRVLFLSDRHERRFNLYAFDPASGELERLTDQQDWDVLWASGHGRRVVFQAGGWLHELDLDSGHQQRLEIVLTSDLPQRMPRWRGVAGNIEHAELSPSGRRVLITARGEVFTVPVEHGSVRNLSASSGQREYTALWSPDGERTAWIVESLAGQYLVVADVHGQEQARHLLGEDFYQLLAWGGGQRRIVYADSGVGLYVIDLDSGQQELLAESARMGSFNVDFSPDGRWLAYTRNGASYLSDLVLHDFESGQSIQVSNGMADVGALAFSRDGQYLYLAASTNAGPIQFGLDMSTQERPYRAGLYALVLAADGRSPLAPRTGDEPGEEEGAGDQQNEAEDKEADKEDKDEAPATRIDLEGLFERMVALPVAQGNYDTLAVAADGALLWLHRPQPGALEPWPGESRLAETRLMRFDPEERSAAVIHSGLNGFSLSADGKTLLLSRRSGLQTAAAGKSLGPEALDLSGLRLRIDPAAEWQQIFDEAWRMQQRYFYADNLHGLDWQAIHAQYRPLVEHVGRREDLNRLLVEMIAELHVGHNRIGGGDIHEAEGPGVGLLGANFRMHEGRWQIERIYSGESWNAFLRGPLVQPGNQAHEGEYVLAINGHELTAADSLFERLQNTVDEQVELRVGPYADGREARTITVEPVGWEGALRLWSWVEANRARVHAASDGRVGYVYLPNTGGAGYTFFNRMFFAQLDRQALIIDERGNGGGQAADYIIEVLSRPHLSNWVYRHGLHSSTPFGALHGPKLMLIDQDAGSGGDYLPWAFRQQGLGTLVGTRTWGGLIGIFANPLLVDGGVMTVPHFRFADRDNRWTVENEGVAPDLEVLLDPLATNQGVDSQLEVALKTILGQLEDYSDDVPRTAPPLPTRLGD